MLNTSYPKDEIKVLLLEGVHQSSKKTFEKAGYSNVELLPSALTETELCERIKNVHLLGIRSKSKITQKVLDSASKLWAIGCHCIGTNQVDLEYARKKGVAVFNSPYSNTRSVAELVIAECVMLVRRIPERSNRAHAGKWMKDAKDSFELRGKTLGIIGYGHIGSQVSVLAEALGMRVLYYDVEPKLPLGNADAIDSLDDLLANSDIVSLHVPADEGTKNLMNRERINQMKLGSYLINLSRGNVVDIDALKDRLITEEIKGAAIDVFPEEPKSTEDMFHSPLQGMRNVILTPHIGGSTREAQQNIGKDAAHKLVKYMDEGVTIGNHSIPIINLPKKHDDKTHRILHIHRNEAGVLGKINAVFSKLGINIAGQSLNTNTDVGYVILDIEAEASAEVEEKLRQIDQTIKVRTLF
ncbi:UNVERIFIED_CONTAM: hypothetical protein GTU68_015722 [Idotea baltica]|nr:hypothetical protein [Idotea baltica]